MGFRANLTICLVAALLLFCPGVAIATGTTIYVDGDAIGANDGSSWTDAFRRLRGALATASAGDRIHVAEGIYRPDEDSAHPQGTGNPAAVFVLADGVIVKGGYAGFGWLDPNARDISAYRTILSGDLEENDGPRFVNNDENSYHVVLSFGADEMTILDGFTITAGNANGSDPNSDGGGMYNIFSSPTLINCTFVGNCASWYGGAMFNYMFSDPALVNCAFVGNYAGYIGGGMENRYLSESTLINCIFSGNAAEHGGGMGNSGADATLTNCLFVGNSADRRGGAMYNRFDCGVELTNSILWDNIAADGPQIATWYNSDLTVSYCDLQGGQVDVNIVASSVNFGVGNIDSDPCFVESGYWADVNDNNVPVESNDPNAVWVEGDYHLLGGSPCIDAADDTSVPEDIYDLDGDGDTAEPLPIDIDGRERLVDGDNDGNLVVDMGAYEYLIPPIEVPMKFTPQALNLDSRGKWMKAHIVLPEGFTIDDVNTNSPAVLEPLGIESQYVNVFVNDDGLIEIEIAFGRTHFCSCGSFAGLITVEGVLTTGQGFYGTDTIEVIDKFFEQIASLASYWLRADCRAPDWCAGLDLDRNSVVNFADFAACHTCCIEVTKQ